MSFENVNKLVTFTNSAILDFSLASFANSIVKGWMQFLTCHQIFCPRQAVPFYWSKKTYFLLSKPKTHLKLILESILNIFQKLHILNYIINFLYTVPKSPTWFFIYDFPLRTKFWILQFYKHFYSWNFASFRSF